MAPDRQASMQREAADLKRKLEQGSQQNEVEALEPRAPGRPDAARPSTASS